MGFTFTNVTWSMRSGTDVNSAAIVASRTTAGNCFVTWSLAGSTASGPFVTPVLGTCDIGNGGLQSPNPGTFAPVVDGGTLETFDLPFAIQGNVMPEPATWALMPAGGVAVARMVRRRRA